MGVDGSETGRALRIFHILCSDSLFDISLLLVDFVFRDFDGFAWKFLAQSSPVSDRSRQTAGHWI
jgi:hypothetical protein